jgi:hypothetical protein
MRCGRGVWSDGGGCGARQRREGRRTAKVDGENPVGRCCANSKARGPAAAGAGALGCDARAGAQHVGSDALGSHCGGHFVRERVCSGRAAGAGLAQRPSVRAAAGPPPEQIDGNGGVYTLPFECRCCQSNVHQQPRVVADWSFRVEFRPRFSNFGDLGWVGLGTFC